MMLDCWKDTGIDCVSAGKWGLTSDDQEECKESNDNAEGLHYGIIDELKLWRISLQAIPGALLKMLTYIAQFPGKLFRYDLDLKRA